MGLRAFTLLAIEPGKIDEVEAKLGDAKLLIDKYACTGLYDIILDIGVDNMKELSEYLDGKLASIDGIKRSNTFIAFTDSRPTDPPKKNIRAFVFVETGIKAHSVLEQIKPEMDRDAGIRDVQAITGEYDLIVDIELDDINDVERLITTIIHKIPGIIRTHTIFAFPTVD